MAIVELTESPFVAKRLARETVKEVGYAPEDIKKLGNYLYVDTEHEGIKKIISSQGGYLVFLDYGRRYKPDKKTGALVLKQDKSNKRVETEAEAKQLRREAEAIRNGESMYDGKPLVKKFIEAVEDFKASPRYLELSEGYQEHGDNFIRHAIPYFANMEPKDISVTDMEVYLKYLLEHGNRNPRVTKNGKKNPEGLSIGSVSKHRTFLKKIWEFFLDSQKYGVKRNVAELARLPKVEIEIDGKIRKSSIVKTHARPLTLEELNYTLNDLVQNEFDRSLLLAVGLAAIGSLRHGEVNGLRCEKYYHNELMKVSDAACEYGGFDRKYYEEHDNLMFIDTAIRRVRGKVLEKLPKHDKIRVSAIPDCLKQIVEYAMEQRKQIYALSRKKIGGKEPLYYPLVNIIKGNSVPADKLSRKWGAYQQRRNKRMRAAGLEPIDIIKFHELRHTHSNLLKIKVADWQISCNMGHVIPDANTTKKVYWSDRQPYRDDVIEFFDSNIEIDWEKALRIPINGENSRVTVNGSGHLVISREETARRRSKGLKFLFKEEEIENMFLPLEQAERMEKISEQYEDEPLPEDLEEEDDLEDEEDDEIEIGALGEW